jgi:hypothetical protein
MIRKFSCNFDITFTDTAKLKVNFASLSYVKQDKCCLCVEKAFNLDMENLFNAVSEKTAGIEAAIWGCMLMRGVGEGGGDFLSSAARLHVWRR